MKDLTLFCCFAVIKDAAPLGLSLLGPKGSDASLLAMAARVAAAV